jgi:ABC-type uncharacterized transport system involved in gliding motility auxiliary subunit
MAKLGRILGIVGLVALLSVPLTLFLWDWRVTWVAVAKLVFGLVALGLWLASAAPRLRRTFRARTAFYGSFAGLFVFLAVCVLLLVNYLAQSHPVRWDLTQEKIFSLAPQSLDVLARLEDDVAVRAFYGAQDPEYETVRAWLERYRIGSPRVVYEFIDPVVRLDAVEKYKIVPGGPRLVFGYRGQEERVRLSLSGPEEQFTGALLKLTEQGVSKRLCFTTGHGEKALRGDDPRQALSLWVRDLEGEGFRVEPLGLLEAPSVPADCRAVVVAGPTQALTPSEVQSLREYLASGGKLMALVGINDSPSLGGLFSEQGMLMTGRAVVYPAGRSPLEVVTDPDTYPREHPIFARFFQGGAVALGQLQAVMPMARQVAPKVSGGPSGALVLAASTANAWAESDDVVQVDQVSFDPGQDERGPVALALVGETPESGARLALLGSSLMAVDAGYRVFPFNRNLLLNVLAWLVHEERKITIRPRTRAASLLRLDESQLKFITFFVSDILPLSILALGIGVWQFRRWS